MSALSSFMRRPARYARESRRLDPESIEQRIRLHGVSRSASASRALLLASAAIHLRNGTRNARE